MWRGSREASGQRFSGSLDLAKKRSPAAKSSKSVKDAQALIERKKRDLERHLARQEKQIKADIRRFKRLGLFAKSYNENKKPTKYARAKVNRLRKAIDELNAEAIGRPKNKLRPEEISELKQIARSRRVKALKQGTMETLTFAFEPEQVLQIREWLQKGKFDSQKTPNEMLAFRINGYNSRTLFSNSELLLNWLFYGHSGGDGLDLDDVEELEIIRVSNHNTSIDTWEEDREKRRRERLGIEGKSGPKSYPKSGKDYTAAKRMREYRERHREEYRKKERERKRAARAKQNETP